MSGRPRLSSRSYVHKGGRNTRLHNIEGWFAVRSKLLSLEDQRSESLRNSAHHLSWPIINIPIKIRAQLLSYLANNQTSKRWLPHTARSLVEACMNFHGVTSMKKTDVKDANLQMHPRACSTMLVAFLTDPITVNTGLRLDNLHTHGPRSLHGVTEDVWCPYAPANPRSFFF